MNINQDLVIFPSPASAISAEAQIAQHKRNSPARIPQALSPEAAAPRFTLKVNIKPSTPTGSKATKQPHLSTRPPAPLSPDSQRRARRRLANRASFHRVKARKEAEVKELQEGAGAQKRQMEALERALEESQAQNDALRALAKTKECVTLGHPGPAESRVPAMPHAQALPDKATQAPALETVKEGISTPCGSGAGALYETFVNDSQQPEPLEGTYVTGPHQAQGCQDLHAEQRETEYFRLHAQELGQTAADLQIKLQASQEEKMELQARIQQLETRLDQQAQACEQHRHHLQSTLQQRCRDEATLRAQRQAIDGLKQAVNGFMLSSNTYLRPAAGLLATPPPQSAAGPCLASASLSCPGPLEQHLPPLDRSDGRSKRMRLSTTQEAWLLTPPSGQAELPWQAAPTRNLLPHLSPQPTLSSVNFAGLGNLSPAAPGAPPLRPACPSAMAAPPPADDFLVWTQELSQLQPPLSNAGF